MKPKASLVCVLALTLVWSLVPAADAEEDVAPLPYGTIGIVVNPDFSSCAVATFSGNTTQPNLAFSGAGQIGGVPYADATSEGPGGGQSVTGCLGGRQGLIEAATVHYVATAVADDDATLSPVTIVATKDCVWLGDKFSCSDTVSASVPTRLCIC